MHIDRIVGRSLMDALRRARDSHGDSAVVLSQEVLQGGDVALAVAVRESAAAVVAPKPRPDPLREACARLLAHGASEAFVERVRATTAERGGEGHAMDQVAEAIAALHPVVALPRVSGATRIVAFVGPTGAGKTSLVARLARRLASAGRKVALASLDAERPGACEPLLHVASAAGLPFIAPRGEHALEIADLYGADLVLVDTSGDARADAARLAPFATSGSSKLRFAAQLVLPATASRDALADAATRFAGLSPNACAITKLDECAKPAPVLEFALERGLPVAFLVDAPGLDRGLHRAAPDHAADLFLRGSLS
jgi:flagellar biosynthesis GTPase FlhF